MRDPAGELANRLHLLRLAQRVFYAGAVGQLLAQFGRRLINLELELLSAALASLKQCPHFILAEPCPRGRQKGAGERDRMDGSLKQGDVAERHYQLLPPRGDPGILTVTGQDDDR